jgi:hypothetical protein
MMIISSLFLLCYYTNTITAWQSSIKFNNRIDFDNEKINNKIHSFQSDYKDHDFFSLLSSTRNNDIESSVRRGLNSKILIGGRNNLYQLELPNLEIISKQQWKSSDFDIMHCLNRSIIINKV